jgi:hypothetical protein
MSDLARQYPPALQPGLYAGTPASVAAGAGLPEASGSEKATSKNGNNGHDYKDDRTR